MEWVEGEDVSAEETVQHRQPRTHRYESFSQRIAKFKVEPVFRQRNGALDISGESPTASFFQHGLEYWMDLNTSANFSNFVRELSPWCSSLPQILHFEQTIFDALIRYIEKRDALSLEPLLKLMVEFARDIGTRFEKYFGPTVSLLSSLAARHTSVDVIEWSFNCLACLFKYLSRLLVPDLRPTYGLMAPLLGREHQKPFVTQFAAEAMAHLTRKAAAATCRNNGAPLQTLLECVFVDLHSAKDSAEFKEYQRGLVLMLSAAAKGVKGVMHSSAPLLLESMLQTLSEVGVETGFVGEETLQGTVLSLVCHVEVDGSHPALLLVQTTLDVPLESISAENIRIAATLLLTILGAKKGSRVKSWSTVLDTLKTLVDVVDFVGDRVSDETLWRTCMVAAVALQQSPLDSSMPFLGRLLPVISGERFRPHFLAFCSFFHKIGPERFQSTVLPYFRRFVVGHWSDCQTSISMLLPKLIDPASTTAKDQSIICPLELQSSLVVSFEHLTATVEIPTCGSAEGLIHSGKAYGYTTILPLLALDRKALDSIRNSLAKLVHVTLLSDDIDKDIVDFALGAGFICYMETSKTTDDVDMTICHALLSQGHRFESLPSFLQAVHDYIVAISSRLQVDENAAMPWLESLVQNLSGPSHSVRLLSLRILNQFHRALYKKESSELTLAAKIEDTPLGINTVRTLSLQIRSQALSFTEGSAPPFIKKALARHVCGLLRLRSSQIEKDAYAAIVSVADTDLGEQEVSDVSFSWIEEQTGPQRSPTARRSTRATPQQFADFEDSHLLRLNALAREVATELADAPALLRRNCEEAHVRAATTGQSARLLACGIFARLPQLVERRSRRFVPLFLSGRSAGDRPSPTAYQSAPALEQAWSRKEQRSMVGVFAATRNPKALYRSSDVYTKLLEYLANGDIDMQKSVLEAILAWKDPRIMPYKDHLRGILDETQFRDEIVSFMQGLPDRQNVKAEDRKEFMSLALRVLYGISIARKGTASGNKNLEAKRRLVLKTLASASSEELRLFIHIAITPLDDLGLFRNDSICRDQIEELHVPAKREIGIVKMVEDMLQVLGPKLMPLADILLEPVVHCLVDATVHRSVDDFELSSIAASSQSALFKSLRQSGYQCLNLMFARFVGFDWKPYMPKLFRMVIEPRIEKLARETAQAPSGLLRVFVTWSCSIDQVFFLSEYHDGLLARVSECLVIPSAKDEVKKCTFKILNNILRLLEAPDTASTDLRDRIKMEIVRRNVAVWVSRVGEVLRSSPSKDLIEAGAELLTRIAPFAAGLSEIRTVTESLVHLLQQPPRLVSIKVKVSLLQCLEAFVPLLRIYEDELLFSKILTTLSVLFGSIRDHSSRLRTSRILELLADQDTPLHEMAKICSALNSFSSARLDEPDFEKRIKAYDAIGSESLAQTSIRYWRPVIYNLLFFLRDSEDFALRTNSSHALRRFLQNDVLFKQDEAAFTELVAHTILPALQHGALEESESVRTEHVSVMADVVQTLPSLPDIQGLQALLAGGDEEASFFNNILHIQQHRRIRALRRLSTEAVKGQFGSVTICQFLMPLVEHFIFQAKDNEKMHNLAAEAVSTTGVLVEWTEWRNYKLYLKKIIDSFSPDKEPERVSIKLLAALADALGRADAVRKTDLPAALETTRDKSGAEQATEKDGEASAHQAISRLALTIPPSTKLAEELTSKSFLPRLSTFLHNKDESVVSLRIHTAVTYVKLVKLFPLEGLSLHLPPVLTDICHILRSRASESRDMARRTLAEIAAQLGPDSFAFILRELKVALTRGYQLHVLSFTLHSLLLAVTPHLQPGALDYCLPQIVQIIMDDIFGTVGKEKDSADYISSMKEVKNSKSYDSMEVITKVTTMRHLSSLTKPVQAILQQSLSLSLMRKVDELLRRISTGISQNASLQNQSLLVFCYDLLTQVLASPCDTGQPRDLEKSGPHRHRAATEKPKYFRGTGSRQSYEFKLACFALDVLRNSLHKQQELKSPSSVEGLLPVINDCLLSSYEEVKISALRLLQVFVRVPSRQIDRNFMVYFSEAVEAVRSSPTTNSDLAQAAIKLITAILRDRRHVDYPAKMDAQVTYLLQRLKQDINEPSRQGATFAFLKAVLSRKILVPEVYEVMDMVSSVMVTSHGRETRDLARGVYLDFMMEYPQGKNRFAKQLVFLVKNLEFQYPEGRRCILEVVHFLFSKVGDTLIQQILVTFMVPLVMVLVNDDDSECREMAGVLIKQLFERADDEKTQLFESNLQTWVGQDENPILVRAAIQCYLSYFECRSSEGRRQIPVLSRRLEGLLRAKSSSGRHEEWEVVYFALRLLLQWCQLYPDTMYRTNSAGIWTCVEGCLSFPHNWVKLYATKLLGSYFAEVARLNPDGAAQRLPSAGPGDLPLDRGTLLGLTRRHLQIMEARPLGQDLATQVVRNLVFLVGYLASDEPSLDHDSSDERFNGLDDEPTDVMDRETEEPDTLVIPQIFSRLSRILRRDLDPPKREFLVPKMASLQLIAALCTQLSTTVLLPSLSTILAAVHHLTDETVVVPRSSEGEFSSDYEALQATAHELMELLRKTVGAKELMTQQQKTRELISDRRDERRRKRKIDAVNDPDLVLRQKRKKDLKKKVKRKEHSMEQRGRRRGW